MLYFLPALCLLVLAVFILDKYDHKLKEGQHE